MTTVKTVNYTAEQTAALVSAYVAAPTAQTVAKFAEKFGKNAKSIIANVEAAYEDIATTDRLDGVTFFSKDTDDWWWFNLRTSNTEPLLRFNCEAKNADTVNSITREVESFIKS